MVKRILAIGFCGAALLLVGASDAQAGPNGRQHNQRARIADGVHDGSLTRGETRRLVRDQVRIERKERRFRRNDGHLGPRERINLNRSLNRSSKRIFRAKHNNRSR